MVTRPALNPETNGGCTLVAKQAVRWAECNPCNSTARDAALLSDFFFPAKRAHAREDE